MACAGLPPKCHSLAFASATNRSPHTAAISPRDVQLPGLFHRYQAILEHGQPAARSDVRGRNSSISSYMLSAFTRALDLFREAIRDHTLFLKRKLVVNKRPVCHFGGRCWGSILFSCHVSASGACFLLAGVS
jgi:hypothetical protein